MPARRENVQRRARDRLCAIASTLLGTLFSTSARMHYTSVLRAAAIAMFGVCAIVEIGHLASGQPWPGFGAASLGNDAAMAVLWIAAITVLALRWTKGWLLPVVAALAATAHGGALHLVGSSAGVAYLVLGLIALCCVSVLGPWSERSGASRTGEEPHTG